MIKTRQELETDLLRAIENLQAVALAYDQGFVNSTISMAVSIRTLVHQTKNSTCLVNQMCKANCSEFEEFPMISTLPEKHPDRLVIFGGGLVVMELNPQGLGYIPVFDENPERLLPLNIWWDEDVISDFRNGYDSPTKYTRKQLILTHADQEGGAHFDPKLSSLHDLGSPEASGWVYYNPGTMSNTEERTQKSATIRQIAYETLRSLFKAYPASFRRNIF